MTFTRQQIKAMIGEWPQAAAMLPVIRLVFAGAKSTISN